MPAGAGWACHHPQCLCLIRTPGRGGVGPLAGSGLWTQSPGPLRVCGAGPLQVPEVWLSLLGAAHTLGAAQAWVPAGRWPNRAGPAQCQSSCSQAGPWALAPSQSLPLRRLAVSTPGDSGAWAGKWGCRAPMAGIVWGPCPASPHHVFCWALLPGTSHPSPPALAEHCGCCPDGASVSMLPAQLPVSWERMALPTDSRAARRKSV